MACSPPALTTASQRRCGRCRFRWWRPGARSGVGQARRAALWVGPTVNGAPPSYRSARRGGRSEAGIEPENRRANHQKTAARSRPRRRLDRGLLVGPSAAGSVSFSLLQTAHGRRLRSGRRVAARYSEQVRQRKPLRGRGFEAFDRHAGAHGRSRSSTTRGITWRQAVEYFADDHYGVDIWYCERPAGETSPRSRRSAWAIRSIPVPTG